MNASHRERQTASQRVAGPFTLALAIGIASLPFLLGLKSALQIGLAVSNLILVILGLILACSRGYRPMLSLFIVFQFVWLTVPAIYQISNGIAAWGDNASVQHIDLATGALFLNTLTLAAFFIGYLVELARHKPAPRQTEPPSDRPLNSTAHQPSICEPRTLIRISGGLTVLSLAMLPLVASAAGGIQSLVASRSELGRTLEAAGLTSEISGGGIVALIRIVPAALATCAVLAVLLAARSARERGQPRSPAAIILTLISTGTLFLYANPMANTRLTFLISFGAIALATVWPRGRAAAVGMTMLTAAILLVAYPLANIFRGPTSQSDELLVGVLSSQDFDGFQQTINSLMLVDDVGHSYGHYSLSSLLFFVPRSLWVDKAIPASIDVAGHRGYEFTNLSLPVQAEMYIDFGWVGLVLVSVTVGWLWSKLDFAWLGRGGAAPLLVAVVATAQIGLIRGPLGAQLPVVVLTVLLTGALVLVSNRRIYAGQAHLSLRSTSTSIQQPRTDFGSRT